MIGRMVAQYRILDRLGEGGMGVVYKAEDTRLRVLRALKFMAPHAVADPEARARFAREARAAATLEHPNICAVHEIGEADGHTFIVMSYLEGETVRARLRRVGRMPLPEALRVAIEVSEALRAAHARGITHRDIKPDNIMLTAAGPAVVLDFGLAKPSEGSEVTRSNATLGTAAYMSPEQVLGAPADPRSDVWSLGVTLQEMLTGHPPFRGDSTPALLYAIVNEAPEPLLRALSDAPDSVVAIVERALAKEADDRYRDAEQLLDDLRAAHAGEVSSRRLFARKIARRRRIGIRVAAALAVCAMAATAIGFRLGRRTAPPENAETRHFSISLPDSDVLASPGMQVMAFSPDSRRLIYRALRNGKASLFQQDLTERQAAVIPGTENGRCPFFSPDGRWLAYFAGGKLIKVPTSGGSAITLCEAPSDVAGSWGGAGWIVFESGESESGLMRVSERGGRAEPVITAIATPGQGRHHYPFFLPGGRALLTLLWTGALYERTNLALVDLKTGHTTVFGEAHSAPRYVATGHVVYTLARSVMALPFDLRRLRPRGAPYPVMELESASGLSAFCIAPDGTFAYLTAKGDPTSSIGPLPDRTPVWVDRQGRIEPLDAPPRPYVFPNLSPSGARVAFSIFGEKRVENWIFERERSTLTRLTFQGNEHLPVWSPDGRQLAVASADTGAPNLYLMQADGSDARKRLTTSPYHQCASSFSPDGRYLVYGEFHPRTGRDIWVVDLVGDRRGRPLLVTRFAEQHGMVSPDGAAIAFTSDASGQEEIYAQPFPGLARRVQVSVDGGCLPMWSRDGTELFFCQRGPNRDTGQIEILRVLSVTVDDPAELRFGAPRQLFEGHFKDHDASRPNYDIAPDGRRFLMLMSGAPNAPERTIDIELNWFSRLRSD
jgi:serine/threonine-protein kinase